MIANNEISIIDKEKWDDIQKINTDSYGKATVDFAREWMRIMETHLKEGQKLEDIWQNDSFGEYSKELTGFMYGIAVQIISQVWKYGNELRILHNSSLGISEEKAKGGIVNPALFEIKIPE